MEPHFRTLYIMKSMHLTVVGLYRFIFSWLSLEFAGVKKMVHFFQAVKVMSIKLFTAFHDYLLMAA